MNTLEVIFLCQSLIFIPSNTNYNIWNFNVIYLSYNLRRSLIIHYCPVVIGAYCGQLRTWNFQTDFYMGSN